jgi:hypothetical protein
MHKAIRVAALAALAGCTATPNYDRHFGEAVRQARAAMTMHPQGSSASDASVEGIDGQAAATAHTRYQNSFKAPPPPQPVVSISAGTNGGEDK